MEINQITEAVIGKAIQVHRKSLAKYDILVKQAALDKVGAVSQ